jgi:hypothetical protein
MSQTPIHPDSPFFGMVISYRPVIGFGDDCPTCGKVTFRYGPVTTRPGRGMPQALIDAQDQCAGHAMFA